MRDQPILAWKVKEGSWRGVTLDGVSMVAVAKAKNTLGDPHHSEYPAMAVLIADERASRERRQALETFAKSMAGRLLEDVVRHETVASELEVGHGEYQGRAKLVADRLAYVETRSLCEGDYLCGNLFVCCYYLPIVELAHAIPAFTFEEAFSGQGVDVVWRRADKRLYRRVHPIAVERLSTASDGEPDLRASRFLLSAS